MLLLIQISCFNSYMVRFKGSLPYLSRTPRRRFNSYMVRFKVYSANCVVVCYAVSIPIWFDLKTVPNLSRKQLEAFQFLYGSI